MGRDIDGLRRGLTQAESLLRRSVGDKDGLRRIAALEQKIRDKAELDRNVCEK